MIDDDFPEATALIAGAAGAIDICGLSADSRKIEPLPRLTPRHNSARPHNQKASERSLALFGCSSEPLLCKRQGDPINRGK